MLTIIASCAMLVMTTPPHSSPVVEMSVQEAENQNSRPLLRSGGIGGPNGTAFDDYILFNKTNVTIVGIRSINISHGDQVDALQVTYVLSNGSTHHGPVHGNYTNPPVTIWLEPEEHLIKLEGKTNSALADQLTITTIGPAYERKVYGPFGKTGRTEFAMEGNILAFHGRSGNLLDSIGVYFFEVLKKSPEYGGEGGEPFDDTTDAQVPPIVGISKLFIWHGDIIGAIQVEYIRHGGSLLLGKLHGETSGNDFTDITFDVNEHIIEMHGETGDNFVDRLEIITRKADGNIAQYGPFGRIGKEPFSIYGNVIAFFGTSGNKIDKLGVYYI